MLKFYFFCDYKENVFLLNDTSINKKIHKHICFIRSFGFVVEGLMRVIKFFLNKRVEKFAKIKICIKFALA